MEHKHAALLRMAADNADQMFDCGGIIYYDISDVISFPHKNWRPVKTTKTIKRWLWADKEGMVTTWMYSNEEALEQKSYPVKLLWSETEFEVEE